MLGRLALVALGVIAYRNRDALGQWLRDAAERRGSREGGNQTSLVQRIVEGLASSGSLDVLLDQFRRAGAEHSVRSWIGDGFNLPLADAQVRAAIDPETLKELAHQLSLSEDELVVRLASELPEAVHRVVASAAGRGTSALQSPPRITGFSH